MSYLDLGYDKNMSRTRLSDMFNNIITTEYETSLNLPQISASKIRGGVISSSNGRLLLDLENGTISVADGSSVRFWFDSRDGTFKVSKPGYDARGEGNTNLILSSDMYFPREFWYQLLPQWQNSWTNQSTYQDIDGAISSIDFDAFEGTSWYFEMVGKTDAGTGYYQLQLVQEDTTSETLQPGPSGGIDANVSEVNPTQNYETSTILNAGNGSSDYTYRSYLKFDISSIPSAAVIVSATISLYQYNGTLVQESTATIGVHQVTSNWTESAVTWNNQPTHDATAEDTNNCNATVDGWYDWDVTTLFSDWHSGAASNYGVVVRQGGETNKRYVAQFRSSDYTNNTSLRPKLTVVYTLDEAVSGSEVSTTSTDPVRLRSSELTKPEGTNTVKIQHKITGGNGTTEYVNSIMSRAIFSIT